MTVRTAAKMMLPHRTGDNRDAQPYLSRIAPATSGRSVSMPRCRMTRHWVGTTSAAVRKAADKIARRLDANRHGAAV
jgi:hypothetical protein